jgi:hypothetical protein
LVMGPSSTRGLGPHGRVLSVGVDVPVASLDRWFGVPASVSSRSRGCWVPAVHRVQLRRLRTSAPAVGPSTPSPGVTCHPGRVRH